MGHHASCVEDILHGMTVAAPFVTRVHDVQVLKGWCRCRRQVGGAQGDLRSPKSAQVDAPDAPARLSYSGASLRSLVHHVGSCLTNQDLFGLFTQLPGCAKGLRAAWGAHPLKLQPLLSGYNGRGGT